MENKICKICNIEKEISNYLYHSPTGYYMNTCKVCHNYKRRGERELIPKKEKVIHIRTKTCIKCKEEKELNKDNFLKRGKNFSGTCKTCTDKFRKNNLELKLNKGPLSEDTIKQCIICKFNKEIKEFSYSKNIGYYSSYCKTCDVERKQKRNENLSEEEKERIKQYVKEHGKLNRHKQLYHSYRKFDFHKDLQYDLTPEYIKEQIIKPCSYCQYPSTGLDRIDNTLGHLQSNCVPCCWECNTARMNNFTYEEMLVIGQAIKLVKDNRKCQH